VIISLETAILLVSKRGTLSERKAITAEHQLALAAREFVLRDHDLDWRFVNEGQETRDRGYDVLLRLHVDVGI
jgi:hypothetical protein